MKKTLSINIKWHKEHKMPKKPTLQERASWHDEHQKYCGCWPYPVYFSRITS